MIKIFNTFWLTIAIWASIMLYVALEQNKKEYRAGYSDVAEVYRNLRKFTGVPNMVPAISITANDSVINAYAKSDEIIITTGMMNFVKSKDELASVIGHEMGHIMLNHLDMAKDFEDLRVLEGAANKFGVYLLLRAGYNPCKAKDLWVRLREQEGDNLKTISHPDYSYRAWQLSFPHCGDY